MALYGGRTGAQLKVMDALTTGYKFLMQPAFVIPVLVIGLVVNVIVFAAIVPVFESLSGPAPETTDMIASAIASVIAAVIAATIGGIILNLYGQVWATMASTGEPPTMNGAFARIRDRWMSVLGAGLISGAIAIGGVLVIALVGAMLGGIGVIVMLVGLVALAFVSLRLTLAGWIAAEGTGAMDSVKASWAVTKGHLLTVVGWSIVIGIVVSVLTAVVGVIVNLIPGIGDGAIGSAFTQTVGSAFGFGAGVTLYRRIKDA